MDEFISQNPLRPGESPSPEGGELFPLSVENSGPGADKAANARLLPGGSKQAIKGWFRDVGISLGIAVFIIIFLYQPVKVEGNSMLPVLEDQERIFINKLVYRLEPVRRGDIVVFHYPRDVSKSYIKRVIAVAGDKLRISEGQVFVNGIALREDYVPIEFFDGRSYPETAIPADTYFVLGDHRSMSNDSREFGLVNRRYIYGKAVFGYWPVEKVGMLR